MEALKRAQRYACAGAALFYGPEPIAARRAIHRLFYNTGIANHARAR